MNMKKILAAATASVLSVSAFAVVASADPLLEQKASNGAMQEKVILDLSSLTDDQIKSATKIEAVVSSNGNYFKGIIGYNSVGEGGWKSGDALEVGAGDGETGVKDTFTITMDAGDLAALDDDGNVAPYVEVQFWWVQPVYDSEGKVVIEDATVAVHSVKVYAGDEVLVTLGDPDYKGPNETPLDVEALQEEYAASLETSDDGEESDDPATSDDGEESEAPATSTDETKPAPDTGVAGVAAVLGVAVVAAGAMVVAKKRK